MAVIGGTATPTLGESAMGCIDATNPHNARAELSKEDSVTPKEQLDKKAILQTKILERN